MSKRKCAVLLVLVFTSYLMCIVAFSLSMQATRSDIAVVLGNEVYKDGTVSKRLKARLDAAIDLYTHHLAKIIVTSGAVGKSGYDEAIAMTHYLMNNGINAQDIITDSKGYNTQATAVNTAKIMQKNNFHSVIIVSQYYHLPRCALAFHQAGIKAVSAAYPLYFDTVDVYSILREAIALPYYFITGLIRKQP